MGPNVTEELAAFVAEAHRNGYAAAQPDAIEEAQGTVITYEQGPWEYRDTYTGSEAFVGHEVVFRADEPVWGMSYYGNLTTPQADRDAIYAFLREALGEATTDRPYRGPARFEREGMAYLSSVEGDVERFDGTEEIRVGDETRYRGWFAGGRVE